MLKYSSERKQVGKKMTYHGHGGKLGEKITGALAEIFVSALAMSEAPEGYRVVKVLAFFFKKRN